MVEKNWETKADNWNKRLFYNPRTDIPLQWISKLAKKSDSILDQGSGVGQYSLTLFKMGFRNIVGLDFSEKLINISRTNNKRLSYKCKFIKGDIRAMPFPNESFDVILSAGIIEHVPETSLTFLELKRVLKRNGYLVIHVPTKISTFTITKKIQQFLGLWKLGYEKSFSEKEFRRYLADYGFEILDHKLRKYNPDKHKIIGKVIQLIDEPLLRMGYGGHHMFFLCKKIS